MQIALVICWFFNQSEVEKNQSHSGKYFCMRNDWRVNTDCDKIVLPLNTSWLYIETVEKISLSPIKNKFPPNPYSFPLNCCPYCLDSNCFTIRVKSGAFRGRCYFAMEFCFYDRVLLSCYGEKKKDWFLRVCRQSIHSHSALFDLKNKWQVDLTDENSSSDMLIFRQIRSREKRKSRIQGLAHRKRPTSKHWVR